MNGIQRPARVWAGILTLVLVLILWHSALAAPPATDRLAAELARLAEGAGGTVGVAAQHLESGTWVGMNLDEPFPMASTYKVAIAVQLLHRVERGEVSLSDMVPIETPDLHPGSGMISYYLDEPGVVLSVHNLLELMLIISDNTATDLLLEKAGGPAAVNARLRELGIEGLRVDRPTLRIITDWLGLKELPPPEVRLPRMFRRLYESIPEDQRRAAEAAFNADPRDTSTPRAMVQLLAAIFQGRALSPENTQLLLDIMRRCETGVHRIKGLLPSYIEVVHKTGTIGGTTNDVGILTLPDDAGHVALAVFIKGSDREVAERERVIAHIARSVYDYFLYRKAPAAVATRSTDPGSPGRR